jgi:hypothetical protein
MVQLSNNVEEGISATGSAGAGTENETGEGVVQEGMVVDDNNGNGSMVDDEVQSYHSTAKGGVVADSIVLLLI